MSPLNSGIYADTVESHESRNGASDDFLEPAQSPLSICLNCGDLAFSVPSCWFGCLSFTLVRFSAIPTFMRFYSLVFAKNTSASRYFAGVLTKFSAHGGILGKDEGVRYA